MSSVPLLATLPMLLAQADAEGEALTLTAGGWAVMVASITVVVALAVYCLYRVLTLPPVEVEEIRGPLEIDTGDTNNAD